MTGDTLYYGLRIKCPNMTMEQTFKDEEMHSWLKQRLPTWRWGFGEHLGVDLVFMWVLDEASLRDFEVEFKLRWL